MNYHNYNNTNNYYKNDNNSNNNKCRINITLIIKFQYNQYYNKCLYQSKCATCPLLNNLNNTTHNSSNNNNYHIISNNRRMENLNRTTCLTHNLNNNTNNTHNINYKITLTQYNLLYNKVDLKDNKLNNHYIIHLIIHIRIRNNKCYNHNRRITRIAFILNRIYNKIW